MISQPPLLDKSRLDRMFRTVRFQGQSRRARQDSPTSASDPERTPLLYYRGICFAPMAAK